MKGTRAGRRNLGTYAVVSRKFSDGVETLSSVMNFVYALFSTGLGYISEVSWCNDIHRSGVQYLTSRGQRAKALWCPRPRLNLGFSGSIRLPRVSLGFPIISVFSVEKIDPFCGYGARFPMREDLYGSAIDLIA
jgi:hypothetical protein